MECYVCGKELGDQLGACPECREMKDKQRDIEYRLMEETRGSANAKNPEFKPVYLLFLAAIFLLAGALTFLFMSPRILPSDSLPTLYGTKRVPCLSGRECVVAYLTPDCSDCREILRSISTIESHVVRNGLRDFFLVIGGADEASVRDFAYSSAIPPLLDIGKQVPLAIEIKKFPMFMKFDSERKLSEYDSSFPANGSIEEQEAWLSDALRL